VFYKTKLLKVEYSGSDIKYNAPWGTYTVTAEIDGETRTFTAEALLNATGRCPNVHDLGLENVSYALPTTVYD
jgi:pyruvate/2-oxoglutarate dehydrogenase complex dihydrolipoamide dehydrogenase (E3) component